MTHYLRIKAKTLGDIHGSVVRKGREKQIEVQGRKIVADQRQNGRSADLPHGVGIAETFPSIRRANDDGNQRKVPHDGVAGVGHDGRQGNVE